MVAAAPLKRPTKTGVKVEIMAINEKKLFHFIMIKPSRYDDEGYPVQWLRSLIPSNSLASVNSLATDCRQRGVLGPDVEIKLTVYDETNRRIPVDKLIKQAGRSGCTTLIGLVGVQSNQFPRAVDLARMFLTAGLPVVIGGFHTAGCISMLPELPDEIKAAQDMGLSIFAGEAEEQRLDEVFLDAYRGELKPIYNYLNDLPSMDAQPTPFLEREVVSRTMGDISSFDLGRGCPFQCSFCTIINVQGRKSRFRSPDDVEKIVRENAAAGIDRFFITDDNFARNRDWEVLFDRMIWLQEDQGIHIDAIIQVDTLCHKVPNFIEKAARAGVNKVFIGLENINPDNLLAAKKRQNKITEYRAMIQKWSAHGIFTYAGYILGFANDTKESILRDIEIIKRELPIDILEFFFLTPLPGSEDHKNMLAKGIWMDPDLNKYNLHHRVTHHPVMSDEDWEDAYNTAWRTYFSYDHMETVIRRHAANPKGSPRRVTNFIRDFKQIMEIENMQPLEAGVVRRRFRRDRKPGLPRENALVFYSKYIAEIANKLVRYAIMFLKCRAIYRKVMRDPNRLAYMDIAIAPCDEGDVESLAIFNETHGGKAAVDKARVQDDRRKRVERRLAEA